MKRGKLWIKALSTAGLSLSIFLSSFGNVSNALAMEPQENQGLEAASLESSAQAGEEAALDASASVSSGASTDVTKERSDAADETKTGTEEDQKISADEASIEASDTSADALIDEFSVTESTPSKEYSVTALAPRQQKEADNSLITRDHIQHGAILHAFCWNFNTIADNMADIADAGYTAVQTSPINECLDTNPGMNLHGPDGMWWYHYQPTDWVIGNYQLGTRDEFKHMCDVADEYGIAVIVDILPNHTTPTYSSISQDLFDAAGGEDALYHKTGKTAGGYTDRLELTYYEMGGLPDVDTENISFQQYFYEFLKDCVFLGADGFRIDTAKHISLPDDPVPASYEGQEDRNTFYPNMREAINEYSEEVGSKDYDDLFVYGEVLQGTNDRLAAYQEYIGGTTASNYGSSIRSALSAGDLSVNRILDYQIYDETVAGRTYTADTEKLVTWVESHDNYMNDGEGSWKAIDDDKLILGWAIIASRDSGTPLFFSRPNNSSTENPYGDNIIGAAGSPIYKAPIVKAVNLFREEMGDAGEYLSNPGGNNQVLMIERSGDNKEGAVLVNASTNRNNISAETHLADGIYRDQVEGSENVFLVKDGVLSGSIEGEGVVVLSEKEEGTGKVVYFYNSENWDSVVARVDGKGDTITAVSEGDGWLFVTVLDDEFDITFEKTDGSAVSPVYTVTKESGTYATAKSSDLYFSKEEAESSIGLKTYSVYFFNTENWASVNAYGWLDGGKELFGGWPGSAAINENGGWYRADIKTYDDITSYNVIFNNGNGTQTVNIEGITPESKDIYFAPDAEASEGQVVVKKFEDKEAAEKALGVSGSYVTAFFYNTEGWDKVCVYTWGAVSCGDWPGKELTQDEDGWYSVVLPAGPSEDLNIIFNNGNNGKQTNDMKVSDMKNRFFLHNGISYQKYGSKKEALKAIGESAQVEKTTVYFYNEMAEDANWQNVYLYVYGGPNGEYNNLVGGWPGTGMVREEGTNWYSAKVPTDALRTGTLTYIFNNGNGTQLSDNRDITIEKNYFTYSSTDSFASKEAVLEYLGIGTDEPEPEPEPQPEPEKDLEGSFKTKWGSTYFVTNDGEKVTGIARIDGHKYYFKDNGKMVTSSFVTVDDKTYYFNKEGHMVTGFFEKWLTRYYADAEGVVAYDTLFTVDGDTYYANGRGAVVNSKFVDFEEGTRYFDSEGKMVKGRTITKWLKKYSFDEEGILVD